MADEPNPWAAPPSYGGPPPAYGSGPRYGEPPQQWGAPASPWATPAGWAGPSGWSPYPTKPRRTGWIVAGSIAGVLLLVFALLAAYGAGLEEGERTAVARGSAPPAPRGTASGKPGPAPTDAELRRVIGELQRFVEKEHRLQFKREVDVELLDDEEFSERLHEGSQGDYSEEERTYTGLGLIEPGTDLDETQEEINDAFVDGFYDSEDGALVVRGETLSPLARGVLVHELTHALQDQNGVLDAVDDSPTELVDVPRSVVEGVADWMEGRYYDSLTGEEQDQYDDEEEERYGSGDPDEKPSGVMRLRYFPYEVGGGFVEDLVDEHGPSALMGVYRSGPTTSEQLMHPEKYEKREAAVKVAAPGPAGSTRGVLGEAGLFTMLAEHVDDEELADEASSGWGGDAYAVWQSGGQTCTELVVAMDTPDDVEELRTAFTRYAGSRPGVKVTGEERLTFTLCES